MNLAATFLFYVCCILCFTVTFCEVYICTSKSLIEEGDTFKINCTVRPLSSAVQFLLDGNAKGECTTPVTGIAPGTCSVGITQNINTDETTLTIASASVATNQGTWKCTHNNESAEIAVDIFKFITVLTNNQYELPATIETSSSPHLEFKVFVACGNQQPIITWILDVCNGSQTGIAVNSPTLTTNTSAGCTSPLVAYTSAIKASDLASPSVETCYVPKATMTYTEKPSVMPSSQFTSQVLFPGTAGCGEGSSNSSTWVCAVVIPTCTSIIAIIIIICCLLNNRCSCRYLPYGSPYVFNWPRRDMSSRYGTLTYTIKQDIPPTWMLFVFSIDRELPCEITWTDQNTKTTQVISENVYNQYKNREVNFPECSGFYQCCRKIANKKDKVNVILFSDCLGSLTTELVVNPSFWEGVKCISDLNLDELHRLYHLIGTQKECSENKNFSYKWVHRPNHHKSYETLNEKGSTLEIDTRTRTRTRGEYRCIVKSTNGKTQVYYFLVNFSRKQSKKENGIEVIRNQLIKGVPSFLNITEKFMYFGYGSNLLKQRLLANNPSANYKTIAKLQDYELKFISMNDPKESLWHGGVATIKQSESNYVWGAVWELDVDAISSLNRQEGFYKAVNVVVVFENGFKQRCRTYLLEPDILQWDNRPSYLYKAVIINGALECKINDDYIAQLLEIEVNKYDGPCSHKKTDNNE